MNQFKAFRPFWLLSFIRLPIRWNNFPNKLFRMLTATVLGLLFPIFAHAQSCAASGVGFYWGKSYFWPIDITLPAQYSSIITSGTNNFTAVSVISLNQGPNNAGTIYFEDGYYGSVGDNLASALPYWDDQLCVDINYVTNETTVNGNCNETTRRPEAGSIVFNNSLMLDPSTPQYLTQKLVQHEVGHMFGLNHNPNSCNSVTFYDR